MNKILLTTALLAFLAVPAMADDPKPMIGGGTFVNRNDGGYQHVNEHIVEELEARIARLQSYLDEGQLYYGNSKVPLPNAINQTKRQLSYWLGQRAQGINVPPGTKIPNNAPIPACSGSLYC